jgi:hypothetical protein
MYAQIKHERAEPAVTRAKHHTNFLEKCAMTLTLEGAFTTGNPIGPNRAGAPEGESRRGADTSWLHFPSR